MTDVQLYALGICAASACAADDVPREDVEAEVNRKEPTGVGPWRITEPAFATGEPNPCPCPHAAGRRHWLLSC